MTPIADCNGVRSIIRATTSSAIGLAPLDVVNSWISQAMDNEWRTLKISIVTADYNPQKME